MAYFVWQRLLHTFAYLHVCLDRWIKWLAEEKAMQPERDERCNFQAPRRSSQNLGAEQPHGSNHLTFLLFTGCAHITALKISPCISARAWLLVHNEVYWMWEAVCVHPFMRMGGGGVGMMEGQHCHKPHWTEGRLLASGNQNNKRFLRNISTIDFFFSTADTQSKKNSSKTRLLMIPLTVSAPFSSPSFPFLLQSDVRLSMIAHFPPIAYSSHVHHFFHSCWG